MEIRYSLFRNNGGGGRVESRRKVIEPPFSMIGELKSRIYKTPPRAWIRNGRGSLPQHAGNVRTHSAQHLKYPWEKLNCKSSNFLPVGKWWGEKSYVNVLIYAKAKPFSREIFEEGIKMKLSFIRDEGYFGSGSQLFCNHWVSSPEFLKIVHSKIPTLYFLA